MRLRIVSYICTGQWQKTGPYEAQRNLWSLAINHCLFRRVSPICKVNSEITLSSQRFTETLLRFWFKTLADVLFFSPPLYVRFQIITWIRMRLEMHIVEHFAAQENVADHFSHALPFKKWFSNILFWQLISNHVVAQFFLYPPLRLGRYWAWKRFLSGFLLAADGFKWGTKTIVRSASSTIYFHVRHTFAWTDLLANALQNKCFWKTHKLQTANHFWVVALRRI